MCAPVAIFFRREDYPFALSEHGQRLQETDRQRIGGKGMQVFKAQSISTLRGERGAYSISKTEPPRRQGRQEDKNYLSLLGVLGALAVDFPGGTYASRARTTSACSTPVRRWSNPWWRTVNRSWS